MSKGTVLVSSGKHTSTERQVTIYRTSVAKYKMLQETTKNYVYFSSVQQMWSSLWKIRQQNSFDFMFTKLCIVIAGKIKNWASKAMSGCWMLHQSKNHWKWECFQKGNGLHHSFLTELGSCYLSQSLSCHSSLIVSGTTWTFVKTGWHLKIALNLRERNLKENKSPWLPCRVRKVPWE